MMRIIALIRSDDHESHLDLACSRAYSLFYHKTTTKKGEANPRSASVLLAVDDMLAPRKMYMAGLHPPH